MTTTWFTADLHLGHRKVAELRGHDDTDSHDDMILSKLDATVRDGDSLWILGDISSGSTRAELHALAHLDAWSVVAGVDLHLIAGNHDGVHPMHRTALKHDDAYRRAFLSVQPFARRRIEGRQVWLSHFPWHGAGDHTEHERYSTVRLHDDGQSWLLHGHTHSPVGVDRERRMIQVGVDAWDYAPVSVNTIADIIREE